MPPDGEASVAVGIPGTQIHHEARAHRTRAAERLTIFGVDVRQQTNATERRRLGDVSVNGSQICWPRAAAHATEFLMSKRSLDRRALACAPLTLFR
jgi:hypothetical protein